MTIFAEVARAIRDEINAAAIFPEHRIDQTCAENVARAALLALAEAELPEPEDIVEEVVRGGDASKPWPHATFRAIVRKIAEE